MTSRKIRHQFCLEEDASAKLEQLCRKASVTKSELVGKAVEAFIEGRIDGEADKRYAQRLNRISRNLSRVRSDTEMILESLALFIRYSITLNAHTPLPDEATQAVEFLNRLTTSYKSRGRVLSANALNFSPNTSS